MGTEGKTDLVDCDGVLVHRGLAEDAKVLHKDVHRTVQELDDEERRDCSGGMRRAQRKHRQHAGHNRHGACDT